MKSTNPKTASMLMMNKEMTEGDKRLKMQLFYSGPECNDVTNSWLDDKLPLVGL